MTDPDMDGRVATVRRFNRFYTQQIGVLREGLLNSPFSLTQARVIFELAHRDAVTATDLSRDLGLDQGYLSRILRGLAQRRLIRRTPSKADGRQHPVSLTAKGRNAFATLDTDSRREIGAMLGGLGPEDQHRLITAMHTIEQVLGATPEPHAPYLLRPHRVGDMGWVVHRHGVLYHEEYGWDERFEALIAEIVARFIQQFDPRREHCWIAERDGTNVGSVFLVRHPDHPTTVAKLRLLLVEPSARGLGIGRRLVQECTRFARRVGYGKITLWTNSVLHAARRIYVDEGYVLVKEEPHHSFGHDLVGETWDLTL